MNKWIEWSGGECPVPISTKKVGIKFRCGVSLYTIYPEEMRWTHNGSDGDIVEYRMPEVE